MREWPQKVGSVVVSSDAQALVNVLNGDTAMHPGPSEFRVIRIMEHQEK